MKTPISLVIALVLSISSSFAQITPADSLPIAPPALTYDTQPKPAGGQQKLYGFVMKNLRYPPKAIADKVGGEVLVQFDILENGSMANFALEKGVRADINAEAMRICKILPNWIPGKLNGKPVRVRYRMPLVFLPPAATSKTGALPTPKSPSPKFVPASPKN